MAYNYATKDGGLYAQKLSQGVLTQPLETTNIAWLDGRRFRIKWVETSGYQFHSRNKGYNTGTAENPEEIYTLGFDRDIEFYVDVQDVDETDRDLAAANLSRVFIESQAQPEVDAYRFSKLAQHAINTKDGIQTGDITPDGVYTTLKKVIKPIRKYGPSNIITYVDTDVMDALEQSKEFVRTITNQNVGLTALESRITSIDGVQLVEVWDDERFKTAFDFTDGYVPIDGLTKDIKILSVVRPAIACAAKFNSIYLFGPGEHTEGDGYLYQNRLYHDLHVIKNYEDGVRALVG